MKKLVRESIHARYPEPKEQFLKWLDAMMEKYDEDWELIVDELVNDEESTDEEINFYFLENGIAEKLSAEILAKRTEFLNYGLDIQI